MLIHLVNRIVLQENPFYILPFGVRDNRLILFLGQN